MALKRKEHYGISLHPDRVEGRQHVSFLGTDNPHGVRGRPGQATTSHSVMAYLVAYQKQ